MTIATSTAGSDNEIEAELIDQGAVLGSVDYKSRPSFRDSSGSWKSSPYVIGIGVAERFAYYGISTNLVSYLTGQLGQSTAASASILNAWFGTASLLPILGAFVADSFIGRFRTIIGASVLYVSGLVFLALSASLTSAHKSECKKASLGNDVCSPPRLQIMFFFFSLYLVALAQGGHTPCVQAFGADQFDDEDKKEKKAKSSFFNWWYCISSGGILVPLLCLTYIQEHVGWELGFGIPAVVMALALVLFLFGTPTYRFRSDSNAENPFVRISRVFVKAMQNKNVEPGVDASVDEEAAAVLSEENSQLMFLDKALLTSDYCIEEEKFCAVQDVLDAKAIIRLIPIWCTALGYSIVYAQPSTLFTKQAGTLDRRISNFEIPAASLQNYFITVSLIIFIPLYDRVFVKVARTITKQPAGISMLQRIGFGLFLSLVSIVYAAIIEKKRLATAAKYGLVEMPNAIVPMSALWLAPQYILSGVADVFAMIGLQEFFYEQVPYDLKSIGLAMYFSILGIGSLLSSFLVSTIQHMTEAGGKDGWFADNLNKAHIDYFYWLLSGLSGLGLVAFVYFSRSYVYRRRAST